MRNTVHDNFIIKVHQLSGTKINIFFLKIVENAMPLTEMSGKLSVKMIQFENQLPDLSIWIVANHLS